MLEKLQRMVALRKQVVDNLIYRKLDDRDNKLVKARIALLKAEIKLQRHFDITNALKKD